MRIASVLTLCVLAACSKKPVEPAAAPDPAAGSEAPAPVSINVDKLVEDALVKLESGSRAELDDAAASLKQALSLEPDRLDAQLNLGVALHLLGDFAGARAQYQNVVASHPDEERAWLYLGAVKERQGDVGGAVGIYRQGLQQLPEAMPLHVALIGALRNQGRPTEAIAAAKEALAVNSNTIDVYNNFGLAYMDQGNLSLARFIFQKALQSIPEADGNAYIHCNLGWVAYLDGDVPLASQELQRAVELDPQLVPALVYLSRVYMDDKNYADTVPLLEAAADITPDNADVQITLGVAYRGVGRLDEAEKAYRKALALDPANPAPHFNLGVLLGDYQKDYDGAIASFNTYVAAGGEKSELAKEYIGDVEKEQKRASRRTKARAEKAKKDAERAEKQRLLDEAEKKKKDAPPPPEPEAPAPDEAPAEPVPEGAPPEEAPPEEAPAAPAPEAGDPEPAPEGGAGDE